MCPSSQVRNTGPWAAARAGVRPPRPSVPGGSGRSCAAQPQTDPDRSADPWPPGTVGRTRRPGVQPTDTRRSPRQRPRPAGRVAAWRPCRSRVTHRPPISTSLAPRPSTSQDRSLHHSISPAIALQGDVSTLRREAHRSCTNAGSGGDRLAATHRALLFGREPWQLEPLDGDQLANVVEAAVSGFERCLGQRAATDSSLKRTVPPSFALSGSTCAGPRSRAIPRRVRCRRRRRRLAPWSRA